MIRLQDIEKRFGAQVLFRGLSWRLTPGDRLGLVGPNGTGKTTLLRILEGCERPDAGSVHRGSSVRVGYLPQEVETIAPGRVLSVVLAGDVDLAQLERELGRIEQELERVTADDPRAAKLTERYGELRHRFEHRDGDRLEARAKGILSGLGVPPTSFLEPLETLSGGWRMRVALARLLLGEPDVLLLDEPTNHLDLDAIGWLEEFLSAYAGAFVVVSHDRYFLNRMVRDVVELEHGALTTFHGNYDDYLVAKRARSEALEQQAKQQAREIAKVERFIERFRYKNTKARQVQSRIRSLGKVERIETARASRRITFDFPRAPRSGDVVLRAEGVSRRFDEHVVYESLDLLLRRGDRVALVGPNGTGKSTLLRLVAGRLEPQGGRLELGHNVVVGYYAQHQLDDLDPRATALEELERAAPGQDLLWARRLLGCFLFHGDEVDKRVAVLSGGEKARLALARLLARPSNLLLVDEPTNHLDLASREVLEDALNEYAGTLVVVSHDRYFINRVATSIGEVSRGRVELVPGDYDEFAEWKRRREAEQPPDESPPAGEERSKDERREIRRREADDRNRRYRERRAVERHLAPLEARIHELERLVRELERRQAEPETYRDPARAGEVARSKVEAEAELERLYAEWERLAERLGPE